MIGKILGQLIAPYLWFNFGMIGQILGQELMMFKVVFFLPPPPIFFLIIPTLFFLDIYGTYFSVTLIIWTNEKTGRELYKLYSTFLLDDQRLSEIPVFLKKVSGTINK
jgi:hypothetical protein